MNSRKIISSKEDKISIVQIVGFCLILLGIIFICISTLFNDSYVPTGVSLSFFIIMLGVAFAFPSLLEGNDGLSTMRIVVFMVTNVICMLLLKIGWAKEITSLSGIGLNQYWVGVIAFVFGAKATQSFFESNMAVSSNKENKSEINTPNSNYEIANSEIIEEYIDKNGKEIIESFPNVKGISIKNKISNNSTTNTCALVFKVKKKVGNLEFGEIPREIIFQSMSGKKYKIITDVELEEIATSAAIVIDKEPFQIGGSISCKNNLAKGTLGLLLNKIGEPVESIYALSCYHVFCNTELKKDNRTYNNSVHSEIVYPSFSDNSDNVIGNVIEGEMNQNSDFAIAKIHHGNLFNKEIAVLGIIPNGFDSVSKNEIGNKVSMCGTTSGMSSGIITSHKAAITIDYINRKVNQYYNNLIETTKFSNKGDSGAAVLNSDDLVIGILIADSDNYSYILPVEEFINQNNYTLYN